MWILPAGRSQTGLPFTFLALGTFVLHTNAVSGRSTYLMMPPSTPKEEVVLSLNSSGTAKTMQATVYVTTNAALEHVASMVGTALVYLGVHPGVPVACA